MFWLLGAVLCLEEHILVMLRLIGVPLEGHQDLSA